MKYGKETNIRSYLRSSKSKLEDKQTKVALLHRKLEASIGEPEEGGVFDGLKDYDIVATRRLFTIGYLMIWEIMPKGVRSVGYKYTNPYWIKPKGAKTMNLPPKSVIKKVLKGLQDFNSTN